METVISLSSIYLYVCVWLCNGTIGPSLSGECLPKVREPSATQIPFSEYEFSSCPHPALYWWYYISACTHTASMLWKHIAKCRRSAWKLSPLTPGAEHTHVWSACSHFSIVCDSLQTESYTSSLEVPFISCLAVSFFYDSSHHLPQCKSFMSKGNRKTLMN